MPSTKPFSDLIGPYKRWYQFGVRSPGILYGRLRNKYRPLRRIKTFYQRGRYGIAESDAWSLDYFLADVIVKGVRDLRKWLHGYPNELNSVEEWDAILEKIETGFALWLEKDGWITDDEERERFDEAAQLLAKWFSALWD